MERGRSRSNRNRKIKKFSAKMQAKLLLVFCLAIIALLVLIANLVHINSDNGEVYAKRVLAQQTYTSSMIPYKRGNIYDSNGTILAFSDKTYNLILDIKLMLSGKDEKHIEPTIRALLESFDFLTKDGLEDLIEERPNSQYVVLAKELSYDEMMVFEEYKQGEEVDKKNINGVWFEEKFVRKYPNDSLASSVIGFTTDDGKGNWGIEQYYNDILKGTDGISYGYMDNELNLKSQSHPPANGNSLVSTINGNAQRIVQDHIKGFNEEFGSKNIGVLIMNSNNGEILAMASNEEYNLNNPADLSPFFEQEVIDEMTQEEKMDFLNGIWRNFVISDSFEPGSTYKPFVLAAGLEEDTIYEGQTFLCDGGEHIGGWHIRCSSRAGHGWLTLNETLMRSCNDALMQMAKSQGRNTFYEYQTFFGFGSKSGIDAPGEAKGLLISEENLNASELATSSFGQSFTTTMIQMVSGYASLINGGNYYKPHLVKEILNEDGKVIESVEPEILKKTVSKKTSDLIKNSLYLTVEEGTAQTAKVAGYEVAGKTGTAQKQPRSAKTYVVSFLGHVPAYDPEIVIYVVVDEPQNVERQANSGIATTLASEVLADVLPFLEIYPSKELVDAEVGENDDLDENTEEYNPDSIPETDEIDENSGDSENPEAGESSGDNEAPEVGESLE